MKKLSPLSKPTIFLHWGVAILFISVFALGIYIADFAEAPAKFTYMGWHKSLGLVVLIFAIVRIVWRIKEGMPSTASAMPKWQTIMAHLTHTVLLLATLAMPLSGFIMSYAGGRAISFFDFELLSAPDKTPWLADVGSFIHHSSVLLISVVLVLHIAAALKHQFIDKDRMLSRMLGKL